MHELRKIQTGLAIEVGAGKHVHFVQGMTTVNDDHCHNFVFATLIECPIPQGVSDKKWQDIISNLPFFIIIKAKECFFTS
ncbi:YmaF family protein [Pelosinus baikalensis]|uniref:YmaF family protein n=1 Tax=Pelosinus baikalensis TaxID=2892015 RepID=A0ABS8HNX1_9FIRM|nr:YmaF family protein [Pelosinus baikalensis]